jgi:hypothetical protein
MLKKTLIVIVAIAVVAAFFLYSKSNRDYKDLGPQLKVSHILYNPNIGIKSCLIIFIIPS